MSIVPQESKLLARWSDRMRSFSAPTAVFVFLFSIYLLSYSGVPTSDDEHLYAAVSQNLVTGRVFEANQLSGNQRLLGIYPRAGPLHPVIGALVLAVIRLIPQFGSFQALFFLAPLYTALTAALIYHFARREGFTKQTGLIAALGFGLATIAFPYAQTYYREPLAMLLLFSAYMVLSSKANTPWKWAAFSLLLLSAALTKLYVLLALPFFLIEIVRKNHAKFSWRRLALAGLIAAAAVLLWSSLGLGNYTRLNANIWHVAIARVEQNLDELRSIEGPKALAGMLISPGKGLLTYSPVLLIGFVPLFRKKNSPDRNLMIPIGTLAAFLAGQLLIYGGAWWNISWSTRFLLPAVPLLIAAALTGIESLLSTRQNVGKILLVAALIFGVLIQLGGVLFSDSAYLEILYQEFSLGGVGDMIWDLDLTPAWRHWAMIFSGEPLNLAFVRNFRFFPALTAILVMILGITLAYSAVNMGKLWRGEPVDSLFTSPRSGALLNGYLVVLMPLLLLTAYRLEPGYFPIWGNLPQASQYLYEHAAEADTLIVDGYQRAAWYHLMNTSQMESPWYSLPENTTNWQDSLERIGSQRPENARTWFLVETSRLDSLENMVEYGDWSGFDCRTIELDPNNAAFPHQYTLLQCEP